MSNPPRPSFMPEVREFSQADPRVVQRPEGVDSVGTNPMLVEDVLQGRQERYADVQVSPGRYDEAWANTNNPQASAFGGVTVLLEKDLAFMVNSFLVDNWTNQWLYEEGLKRFIPPYSGGWIYTAPIGYQKARVLLRAPSAYAQPAVLAGEFVWMAWHEATLPPSSGIVGPALAAGAPSTNLAQIGGTNVRGDLPGALSVLPIPTGYANPVTSSATGAASVLTATLAANAVVYTWITGFEVTGTGATAVLIITVTVTGTVSGTLSYVMLIPAGVQGEVDGLNVQFSTPIRSSAVNTAIVVNVPSFGAGNTNAAVVAHGFQI